MTEHDVGPIDYLALEFPHAKVTGSGMAILLNLADAGIIRILDLRFLLRGEGDSFSVIAVTDLDNDGELDLAVFEGVESGLLDHDDLAAAAALVAPGTAVGVLVYENTWAGPFVTAMTQAGAQLLASARIPATDVISALDSLEAQPA